MNYKKFVFDMIIIMSAFFLFTAWYNARFKASIPVSENVNRYYKIYLITTDKEYQYWNYLNQGAADMAASVGVTYLWDAPAKRDALMQIEVIQRAVDDGANALLVAADDPKKISAVIEDAKARGVKVIYVDSPAYEEAITTLATDNYTAGRVAGSTMLAELEQIGVQNGSIGIVSIKGKENSDLREQGFRDIITADGRFNLLDTVYSNGEPADSQEVAERIIGEIADLVGLYGTNEGTTVGVGNAIQAANRNIVGIGFDKTDATEALIKEGGLKAIMVQNPYSMGYLGMAEAIAALLGKNTGPSYIDTGVSVYRGNP